jgi:hypothetical protein
MVMMVVPVTVPRIRGRRDQRGSSGGKDQGLQHDEPPRADAAASALEVTT